MSCGHPNFLLSDATGIFLLRSKQKAIAPRTEKGSYIQNSQRGPEVRQESETGFSCVDAGVVRFARVGGLDKI